MKRINKKVVLFIAVALSFVAVFSVVVYAAILRTYTRGEIEVSSETISVETVYTSEGNDYSFTYNKAGDKKDININVSNNCEMNIHRYYSVELKSQIDKELASAIMVYYNGEFVDTLLNLDNNLSFHDIDNSYALLAQGKSALDTISFELHQAAQNNIFNNKEITLKVTTYSENVDYEKYQIVTNENEFMAIINDINSNLLTTTPSIVLANSITLNNSYNIISPVTIQTNGYNLNGEVIINDNETTNPDALLTVLGSGSVTASLGTYYDKDKARELVANYANKVLLYGIKAGSTPEEKDIIGPYSFYNITVETFGSATFVSPTLTASSSLGYTKLEKINFKSNGKTTTISYRHVGSKTNFDEENVLMHLPQTSSSIVTNDLFLPTFLPEYNATITWTSSNESVMSNNGNIVNDTNDREPIILSAIIKINDKVYTRSYSFFITSNNNQVNFQKLVKDISPLIIKKKYDSTSASSTTYSLPIVTDVTNGEFGLYDYRTSFTSPSEDETFNWEAHDNIHLVSLTYSKYYDGTTSNPIDTYDYITVENNQVKLVNDTLSNYAKIIVTGEFDNGESYSAYINISIALGSDTELLEKAFNNVDNALGDISILGNILKTRLESGMLSENGDFYLPATYGESYTIDYQVSDASSIITVGSKKEDVDGSLFYKFSVDPTKFNSVETAIPVRATVTYNKTDGSSIVKTKVIYIDTPAAVHVKDLGNVSIFNSLKYQVVNALPAAEKKSTGFSGSSVITYSGYDYILLRDIVGDSLYLSDYTADSLYLTMNGYDALGLDGASGLSTVKLNNNSDNDSNTTDTLAYDFIKLISWATGNTKELASQVLSTAGKTKLSSTLLGYKSNGETYLTESELDVLEAFFKACTNDNGTLWNQVKANALETAPGRIYDNADLLVTILKCLTTEKGTGNDNGWWERNGKVTYGTIYAKYLEVINRYAITTSENEEPMSPAQEVYNSKFYYSFTTTAQNSTNGNATTLVSFPCKYYDINGNLVNGYCNRYNEDKYYQTSSGVYRGTYAGAEKRGDANVDLYANATGHPYDSDKTKYITSAELMVLKAFWLGAIALGSESSNANVLREFNASSKALIASTLAADSNGILPYPNYAASDFTYYGQALLNAFDACLTIPTYFTSNGISLLINSFYENYDSTGYSLREYGNTSDTTTFKSVLVSGVPAVTNLDNLEGALTYFSNVTRIDIEGNDELSIFLSEYGLNTSFARITLSNSKVTNLTMQYVSPSWNTFDLTNIKHLKNLTDIDISNNLGIKSVNPLLNVNRSNYRSVDFYNIGETYDYNEFVIDNLASSTCVVYYSNLGGNKAHKNEGNPSLLVNLGGIDDFVSEHLYLTNVIYNDDGTTTDVCWRVEQGNEINGQEINSGGELVELNDIREMNLRISPYYYCETTFTYNNYRFIRGGLYRIVKDDSNLVVTPINVDGNGNLLYEVNPVNGVPSTDFDSISENDQNLTVYDEHLKFSGEYSREQTPTNESDTIYSQDSSIQSNTVNYQLRFTMYLFSFTAGEYNTQGYSTGSSTYYLSSNGTSYIVESSNTDYNDKFYYAIVSPNEANFIVELRNNNFRNTTDEIMQKYNITPTTDNGENIINIGSGLQNGGTIYGYYIYNISAEKFIADYGFSEKPESLFNISYNSDSGCTLYNTNVNKYLEQSKVSSTGENRPYKYGIVYYGSLETSSFTGSITDNHHTLYRAYWQTSGPWWYTPYSDAVICQERTPLLSITKGKDLTHTVTFNCCYIGSGSEDGANGYDKRRANDNKKFYDTGAFLLINKNGTYGDEAKFCFLTEEDKDRLEAWFENPMEDITVGSIPQDGSNYYIYCPYTRHFIMGGTSQKDGEIYTTVSEFNRAQLYYIHHIERDAGRTDMRYYITAYPGTGSVGFNAYGGINSAIFVASYTVADHPNSTVYIDETSPFTIDYSIRTEHVDYIAYQVDYTVARVRALILERDISKEYKFDNFYYLKEDVTIGGITYKAGNVIRFVCDAYYGTQYEAYIEYYELILTYYDDANKTNNATHKHTINQFNTAEYVYYYYGDWDYTINDYPINIFSGEIIYNKLTGLFEKYNESATYTTHTSPNGITVDFPETKWIYTSTSFDEVKSGLYLDNEGRQSAANATYVEGTTYYKPEYVVATVFRDEFERRKSTLYTDQLGTKVSNNAVYNPAQTYYEIGYTAITTSLDENITETYVGANDVERSIEVPVFEYYKNGIYTDQYGTRVALNATYNPNAKYYFLQPDGTYSEARPTVYSALISDYVSLSLDATTFEYFKHNIYLNNSGTLVDIDAQYNSDIKYYRDDYVASKFRNEILNKYRNVLYKDSTGTPLDQEETFNPNITYYTNNFVNANVTSQNDFNNRKSRLYADEYGLALASNATYNPNATYYVRTFEVANPGPKGNTTEDWITTKNSITRLYSHTKLTNNANLNTYLSDYSKVYSSGNYPTIYKYVGEGMENIYADPEITVSYEPVRTGTVTSDNFDSLKSTLYADASGTPLSSGATYTPGMIYYIRTWKTVANIVYSNVSYEYNAGYYLIKLADNALMWQKDQDGVNSNTAGTMDAILDEANSHFNDSHYNEWYGKHYAYNGFTMQSSKEILDEEGNVLHGYNKGYVYRIVVNSDNTAFVWQRVYRYSRKEGAQMVIDASTGEAQVGDTIWATSQCFGGFYTANKFYRIVNDDFTKTLNVIQFTDVTVNNTNNGYTDIQGQKIRYIKDGDYLGYAGTFEIIISAVVRESDGNGGYIYTDSVRTYKIKFVGTVIM